MMQQDYGREDDYGGAMGRRQDKVLAAKMAFGASAGGGYRSHMGATEPEQSFGNDRVERRHRYGLWRFGAAVVLFFAFMAGTYFDVSFQGWNKERLEKMMADDTTWKQVVREVSNVMEHLP